MQLTLTGATVVDTSNGALVRDMTIVMDAGKIAKIAPAASADSGGAGDVVDARGKFVVPGYLDCHAHPFNAADPEGSLTLMLANGITGFRQMSGTPETARGAPGWETDAVVSGAGTARDARHDPHQGERRHTRRRGRRSSQAARSGRGLPQGHRRQPRDVPCDRGRSEATGNALSRTPESRRCAGGCGPCRNVLDRASRSARQLLLELLDRRDRVAQTGRASAVTAADLGADPEARDPPRDREPVMFTAPAETERYARVIDTYSEAKCASSPQRSSPKACGKCRR